jgi:hypothetical protein
MKHFLIVLALAGFACAQSPTFGMNYSSIDIALRQSSPWPPLPPTFPPQIQLFIAGNINTGATSYQVTVVYLDGNGKSQSATQLCTSSLVPYDDRGNTTSWCVIFVDAINGAEASIQPQVPAGKPSSASVRP